MSDAQCILNCIRNDCFSHMDARTAADVKFLCELSGPVTATLAPTTSTHHQALLTANINTIETATHEPQVYELIKLDINLQHPVKRTQQTLSTEEPPLKRTQQCGVLLCTAGGFGLFSCQSHRRGLKVEEQPRSRAKAKLSSLWRQLKWALLVF